MFIMYNNVDIGTLLTCNESSRVAMIGHRKLNFWNCTSILENFDILHKYPQEFLAYFPYMHKYHLTHICTSIHSQYAQVSANISIYAQVSMHKYPFSICTSITNIYICTSIRAQVSPIFMEINLGDFGVLVFFLWYTSKLVTVHLVLNYST
jgi:hypothetical protein